MTRVVIDHRQELFELCREFNVQRLELFGSGAGARFDPDRSDLDFLVEFQPLPPGKRAPSYFGLLSALRDLFGRPIDLVEPAAIRNPYFREGVEQSRAVVYEAPVEKASA